MFVHPTVSLRRNMLASLKTAECAHGKVNIKNELEARREAFFFNMLLDKQMMAFPVAVSEAKTVLDGGNVSQRSAASESGTHR